MAGKQSHVDFNNDFNVDALIHSVLDEVHNRYRSDNLIENDDFEAIIQTPQRCWLPNVKLDRFARKI